MTIKHVHNVDWADDPSPRGRRETADHLVSVAVQLADEERRQEAAELLRGAKRLTSSRHVLGLYATTRHLRRSGVIS